MDNDYEDFDGGMDDFESGSDDKVENITDSTETQMDAIADLLSGDSSKADALAEKGGRSSKSVGGSVNVDAHGRMDFGGNDTPQAPVQQESEYGISGLQTRDAIDTAQREVDQATAAYAKLTEMYNSGEIDDATFQHYSNVAGNHAGIHTRQLLESQLAQRDHADQQRRAYDYLESEFPGKFTPEARTETLNSIADWMTGPDVGLNPDYLRDIEDPAVLRVAMLSMQALQTNDELKDTVASQKAQIRRLKQARGEGRSQGRRAAQVGNRSGQDAVIDEVAALLSGAPSKGGRR